MKKVIIPAIILALILPIVPVHTSLTTTHYTEEEYTTTQSYVIWEEVQEPYVVTTQRAQWADDGSWDRAADYVAFTTSEYMEVFQSVTPGRWIVQDYQETRYRTYDIPVTKFRDVTQTRKVGHPVVHYSTRHISVVRWICGG